MLTHVNDLTRVIIGAAIEVHRSLGPGLLESALPLPLEYKDLRLTKTYNVDLLVDDAVVVEVKSIAELAPIHEAQLLTYMRLGGWKVGLLLNFNEVVLKKGLRREYWI